MNIDRLLSPWLPRVWVFTSPKAGSGHLRQEIPRLLGLLQEAGVDASLVHCIADLQTQLKLAPSAHPAIVVAAGGDGTLALAAGAIGPEVALVPMPLGTENLLARHFGQSAMAESVLTTIRHGHVHPIDAGTANSKQFLIMATCGFDAEVVRGMHLTRRGHIRRLSYLRPIARAMQKYRFPNLEIRVDGGEAFHAGWAMVFNLPCYAVGLAIEPGAIEDDGQLDVIAFTGRSVFSGLKYLMGISSGRHLGFTDVIRCRGRVIEIAAESRAPYQLDGDYAGHLPLRIETQSRRVQLLLPPIPTQTEDQAGPRDAQVFPSP